MANSSETEEEGRVRKILVAMVIVFFAIGIILVTFAKQESNAEESILSEWDNMSPSTINPQNPGPHWGIEMEGGSFFQLNVSASDVVRVKIGTLSYDNVTEQEVLTNPIFDEAGMSFTQKIAVEESTTYDVEIENQAATPVTIWGSVLAEKMVIISKTVYPDSSLGTLSMLGGLTSLIYGILTKPKKRRSK